MRFMYAYFVSGVGWFRQLVAVNYFWMLLKFGLSLPKV